MGEREAGLVGDGTGSWQRLMTPPPQPVADGAPRTESASIESRNSVYIIHVYMNIQCI